MNENSYLDPAAVRESCAGAGRQLKCNNDGIFVEYDTADSKEIEIVANHGKDTVNIINLVNCHLELDISENETFTRPDEVYEKITDEISDNPDKEKNIMMQSKGGNRA